MSISYAEAKNLLIASGLKLKSEAHYRECATNGSLPPELPKYPYEKFRNKGWISWGDFLGTGYIAASKRSYVGYEEAKRIIAGAIPRPRTRAEYEAAIRSGILPGSLPLNAPLIYKNSGWKGVGDYLGTGRIATQDQKFMSYGECKQVIQAMKTRPTSQKEWQDMAKGGLLPAGVPHDPVGTYPKEFEGYPTFLGFHRLASISRPELRIRAELEAILGDGQVQRWERGSSAIREIDLWIPAYEFGIEYDGVTWHLGKEMRDRRKNELARQLGISIFRIREQDPIRKRFLETIDAKLDIKYDIGTSLHAAIVDLFRLISDTKTDIPSEIRQSLREYSFSNDFVNQKRYLELVSSMDDRFMSYEEAKTFLSQLSERPENQAQYRELMSRGAIGPRIPKDPYAYYKESGWISWGDFLGTKAVASFNKKFLTLNEARQIISALPDPPKNHREYLRMIDEGRLTDQLPRDPYNTYKKDSDWKGMPDLLGQRNRQAYVGYEQAKKLISEMDYPIQSQSQYRALSKQGLLPEGLPGGPQGVYADKGWVSWYDFLGK